MQVNHSIYVEDFSEKHKWDDEKSWLEKYDHPLWKRWATKDTETAAGHGGIDFFVLHGFVEAIKRRTVTPLDVYDAAAWSAITPLSERSIELGNQTAFRLRQGDETLRNDDMGMRTNARYDRFRIEAPETLTAPPHLSFAYRSDSVVFLAEGSGPFVLAAGSAHARHPFYPIDLALASIRSKAGKDWQPPLAKLGAAKASAGDAALKVAPPPVPWRRWLLWAILVGGAALIGALAISLLRGAKTPPP